MWFDLIPLSLLNPPSRLKSVGRALIYAGGLLALIGAIGQLATTATSAVLSLGGGVQHEATLAQVYPTLPTWWIPEGPVGFGIAALLFLTGLVASSVAEKVHRHMY